ncbi:MAG: hypothetical protein IJK77_03145, partial [Lachnospiraceae bacterium]|nr:hypothetical protein [Lachnospiraceae bacterium]
MFIEGTGGISVGPGTPNLIPAGTTLFTLYFTMTSQYEKGQNYQFALKCEAWDFDEDDYSWSNQSFTAVVHEHAYGEPEWEWTADYSSATASFACVGGDDTQIVTDDEIAMAEVTQATCTGNKVVKYTAEVTFEGETYSDTKDNVEVANTALGHNWGEWTVTTPATCTTAGEKTRECSRCHETETEPVAALGHNMTAYAAVEAKCEEDGNSAYWYCDRCQKYFSDENGENEIKEGSWVIEALGHNWGEWTVTTPATCTTAGEKTRECGRCHK